MDALIDYMPSPTEASGLHVQDREGSEVHLEAKTDAPLAADESRNVGTWNGGFQSCHCFQDYTYDIFWHASRRFDLKAAAFSPARAHRREDTICVVPLSHCPREIKLADPNMVFSVSYTTKYSLV